MSSSQRLHDGYTTVTRWLHDGHTCQRSEKMRGSGLPPERSVPSSVHSLKRPAGQRAGATCQTGLRA